MHIMEEINWGNFLTKPGFFVGHLRMQMGQPGEKVRAELKRRKLRNISFPILYVVL